MMNRSGRVINTRQAAEAALLSGDAERVKLALAQMIYIDTDWEWLINCYMRYVDHPDPLVRELAAIKLGDVALIHRKSTADVLPALRKMLRDPVQRVHWSAQETIEIILSYVPGTQG